MEIMSFSKALSIFGLKSNYTEEDLKKRYRELVKENHPDYHMNASQKEYEQYNRKTQDINEAHEVLKRNLNRSTTYTYERASTYWSHQSYQGYGYRSQRYDENLIIKRNEAIKKVRSYLKPCDAEKLRRQVSDLIIKYIIIINSSQDINLTLINFKIDLERLYRNYIQLYCKKHNIPSFIIKSKDFNYDCDCAKLFNQLKDCESIVSLDISKIIRKHQYHDHFKILEKQILEERDKLREKINNDTSLGEYLDLLYEYDNQINKLIIDYNRKYREFKFALDKLSHQLDYKVRNCLYDNIKEIVLKSNDDELAELLKSAIEESRPKKDSETEKETKESHLSKIPKAREIIFAELRKKYLANSNSLNIDMINKLFIKAAELLYSENCTLKIANEINKITFENPEEEYERLIKLSTNKVKTFEEFLCIKVSNITSVHKIHKAKIISYNEKNYYEVKNISIDDEKIDEKELERNYVRIDDFLSDAIFLGYTNNPNPFVQVLYYDPKTKKVIIRVPITNAYEITDESILSEFSFIRNKATDIYKNKAYLKEEMSEYFDKEYEKKNKTNKNRSR